MERPWDFYGYKMNENGDMKRKKNGPNFLFKSSGMLLIILVLLGELHSSGERRYDSSLLEAISVCLTPTQYQYPLENQQFIFYTYGSFSATEQDDWELQIYRGGRWRSTYSFCDDEILIDGDRCTFSIRSSCKLQHAQYRIYEKQGGKGSESFCIGELKRYTASDLVLSNNTYYPECEEVTLTVGSIKEGLIVYTLQNTGASELSVQCGAYLEIYLGEWCTLPCHFAFDAIRQNVPRQGTYTEILSTWVYDLALQPGHYRVVKTYRISGKGVCLAAAEFDLTAEHLESRIMEQSQVVQTSVITENGGEGQNEASYYCFQNIRGQSILICSLDDGFIGIADYEELRDYYRAKTHIHMIELAEGESIRVGINRNYRESLEKQPLTLLGMFAEELWFISVKQ